MPASSGHTHHFLRIHRPSARALKAPLADPRYDTDAYHSPYLSPSPVLSSRPSSAPGTPKAAVYDTATGVSLSLASSNPARPQTSTGRLCVDGVPGDSNPQYTQISRPITPINVVDANSTPKPDPQGSVTRPPAALPLPYVPSPANSTQSLHPLGLPTTLSQQSSISGRQSDLPPVTNRNQGMFYQAHNISATGNFIDVTNNFTNSNKFMKELLKETIPGAAADSSARDPPPRCHPGTRLAVLDRCLHFIAHCDGTKKMRWVVGSAGVGKSAVMQSVTESPQLKVASNASVFFSINGRNDGTRAIMTLSYQFAAKSTVYRKAIEGQVADDPHLLQSSMTIQFEKFIVQLFIHNPDLNTLSRVLIVIDGLDECNDTRIQVELLRLISTFCTSHPSSPIVWLIASRPEPHITSFFSRPEVAPAYEKEEIAVDSNEARADVERYLRHELAEIGKASDFLGSQWPDEQHLWKLASAAGGLFAYANTAVRYIGDSSVGDPVSQLADVLNVIDELPLHNVPQEQHPMALLDALYARILSNIPPKIMINARKLLLFLASDWDLALRSRSEFIIMCNWLGMTADEAYAALNRLRSILNFPQRHEAHRKALKPFHKSLIDYLYRSDFSTDIKPEARQIKTKCAFRVLEQAPSGIDFGEGENEFYYGELVRNGGTGANILTAWRADEGIDWDDNKTRMSMYKLAVGEVAAGMKRGDLVFQSESCIRLLTIRFFWFRQDRFPYHQLCDFVFDKSRCHQFMKQGILTQIPANAISASDITQYLDIKMQFRRLATTTSLPDPWNSSCTHEREGQWEKGKEQNWTTTFGPDKCGFCTTRLKRQLETLTHRYPDRDIMIMFTSELRHCVELHLVDPEDDTLEWTYWVWILYTQKQRKELGSTI